MGIPLVNEYKGMKRGDTAVLSNGRRVPIRDIEILTFEGASLGLNAIYTPDGTRVPREQISGYEKTGQPSA